MMFEQMDNDMKERADIRDVRKRILSHYSVLKLST